MVRGVGMIAARGRKRGGARGEAHVAFMCIDLCTHVLDPTEQGVTICNKNICRSDFDIWLCFT